MKPNAQETRETFRDYAINERAIYEGIEHPARLLAANLRAAIATINRKHAAEIGGADLIETDADKRAAISVYIDEIREVIEWELIGEANAERRERNRQRYGIEETGGVITVTDNLTGFGFRFNKGDKLAQFTLTVLIPDGATSTPEGMAHIKAVTNEFTQYAAERFPVEFNPDAADNLAGTPAGE